MATFARYIGNAGSIQPGETVEITDSQVGGTIQYVTIRRHNGQYLLTTIDNLEVVTPAHPLPALRHLKRWTRPQSYIGASWPEYFVFLGQNRDSSTLERSNFECGLSAVGGESDTVLIIREGHFLCGWIEWIAIHESNIPALETADRIMGKLLDYPVVNEDKWSELQYAEACNTWASWGIADRLHACQKYGISIFASRRNELPEDSNGELVDYLAD